MKVKEIKEKAQNFYYQHRLGIWVALDTAGVVTLAALWRKVGYIQGVRDCSDTIQRIVLDSDPETFVKVDKMITDATKAAKK